MSGIVCWKCRHWFFRDRPNHSCPRCGALNRRVSSPTEREVRA